MPSMKLAGVMALLGFIIFALMSPIVGVIPIARNWLLFGSTLLLVAAMIAVSVTLRAEKRKRESLEGGLCGLLSVELVASVGYWYVARPTVVFHQVMIISLVSALISFYLVIVNKRLKGSES